MNASGGAHEGHDVSTMTITPMRPGTPFERPYCWTCRRFIDAPDSDDTEER